MIYSEYQILADTASENGFLDRIRPGLRKFWKSRTGPGPRKIWKFRTELDQGQEKFRNFRTETDQDQQNFDYLGPDLRGFLQTSWNHRLYDSEELNTSSTIIVCRHFDTPKVSKSMTVKYKQNWFVEIWYLNVTWWRFLLRFFLISCHQFYLCFGTWIDKNVICFQISVFTFRTFRTSSQQ